MLVKENERGLLILEFTIHEIKTSCPVSKEDKKKTRWKKVAPKTPLEICL